MGTKLAIAKATAKSRAVGRGKEEPGGEKAGDKEETDNTDTHTHGISLYQILAYNFGNASGREDKV